MRIDRLYDRLFASCSTVNQLNDVHIRLENRMTPREACDLSSHVVGSYAPGASSPSPRAAEEFGGHAVAWAMTLATQQALAGAGPPSVIRRTWIRGGATLYRRSPSPARTLLVCLTGNARRMMMPAPTFLQQLSPFDADVLKLETRDARGFVDGVPGHSTDFPSTLNWLAGLVADHGSPRLATMGTSLGGLPAIVTGLALPASSILAAGAIDHGAAELAPGSGLDSMESVLTSAAGRRASTPALSVVYAAGVERDAEAARRISAVLPCRELVGVEDSTHNCLYPLVERGGLGDLLERALFVDR